MRKKKETFWIEERKMLLQVQKFSYNCERDIFNCSLQQKNGIKKLFSILEWSGNIIDMKAALEVAGLVGRF